MIQIIMLTPRLDHIPRVAKKITGIYTCGSGHDGCRSSVSKVMDTAYRMLTLLVCLISCTGIAPWKNSMFSDVIVNLTKLLLDQ